MGYLHDKYGHDVELVEDISVEKNVRKNVAEVLSTNATTIYFVTKYSHRCHSGSTHISEVIPAVGIH
jgi:hypothetical protein